MKKQGIVKKLLEAERLNKLGYDPVNKPKHYNSHPSGIQAIQITRHMNFNIGNAIKYLWRTDHKNGVQDLEKAVWYIQDEIARLKGEKRET